MTPKLTLCLIALLSYTFALAEDSDGLDKASQEALLKTQQMLSDPKLRKDAISKDTKAQEVDAKVQSLAGSSGSADAIYGLSADIMDSLVKESKGDPVIMQKLINEAMKDPAGFAEKWTPEQKAKLKAIAHDIPDPTATKKPTNRP
jgi:hypothetical protein